MMTNKQNEQANNPQEKQKMYDLTGIVKQEIAELVYANMLLRAEINELKKEIQEMEKK